MFYDNGRIYYTVAKTGTASANNNKLYYRYFNPESEIVGANLFVASTGGEGINWGNVRGMTMASGKLIYALTDGRLYSVNWDGTKPTGAVTQISAATTWQSRGMFVYQQLTDAFAPSKPGKPSGTSASFDSIDLTWQASTDNVSGPLTYRVYRDGGWWGRSSARRPGPCSYHDPGLGAGTTHTYQVDAVDASNNTSAISDTSDPITVLAPDTTPPTDPGTPTGVGSATSRIDLTWAASNDAVSTNLTYRVFRDSPGNQIAQFQSTSTTTVSFTDAGLWPGSTHTYWVEAIDADGSARGSHIGSPRWRRSSPTTSPPGSRTGRPSRGSPRTSPSARDAAQRAREPGGAERLRVPGPRNHDEHGVRQRQHQRVEPDGRPGVDLMRLRTAANGAISKVALDNAGPVDRAFGLRRHPDQLQRVDARRVEPRRALRLRHLGSGACGTSTSTASGS